MKRTQLYIPEETHNELFFLAIRSKKTISQLIREILKEGIAQKKTVKKVDTLEKLANYGETAGPKDLSSNLDKYLYGQKK